MYFMLINHKLYLTYCCEHVRFVALSLLLFNYCSKAVFLIGLSIYCLSHCFKTVIICEFVIVVV